MDAIEPSDAADGASPPGRLARLDELEELEARRAAVGGRVTRTRLTYAAVYAASLSATVPVVRRFSPMELPLPWFIILVFAVLLGREVLRLVSDFGERRRLDEEIETLLASSGVRAGDSAHGGPG